MDYLHFISRNAHRLRELHARISVTGAHRQNSPEAWAAWLEACQNFHALYDPLAFPGGQRSAKSRILAGNPDAIETALAFLELRPYFFRSGYFRDDLFTWLKRLHRERPQAITDAQLDRLIAAMEIRDEHRSRKHHKA